MIYALDNKFLEFCLRSKKLFTFNFYLEDIKNYTWNVLLFELLTIFI